MAHPLSRHAWVLNLVVITACALLASKALGRLAETRLPVISATVTAPPVAAAPLHDQPRDVSAVTGRNIFCSTCEPVKQEAADAPGTPDAPTTTALDLKLLATLVSQDTTTSPSYAAITATESTAFYGVGAKVKGALIISISERRVTLLNGGRLEVLGLLKKLTPQARQTTLRNVKGFKIPRARPGLQRIARGSSYHTQIQIHERVFSSPGKKKQNHLIN